MVKQEKQREKKWLLMKFGGTSVGSVHAIQQACQIIKAQHKHWGGILVVISAMGGVTNRLIECSQAAIQNDIERYTTLINSIQEQHQSVIRNLLKTSTQDETEYFIQQKFKTLKAFCDSIQVIGEITPRGMDTICSLGEQLSAYIFSTYLQAEGLPSRAVDASNLIITDDNHQNARPLMAETCQKCNDLLIPLLDDGTIPVITGFIGATRQGIITTLGRGGSDYSASIIADCLEVDEVWNCTDVNGVMTADPSIVEDARVIPELAYDEMSEMAYFGAKVLHPKTIQPIIEKDIPLRVINTFNPEQAGTRISSRSHALRGKLTAVTSIQNLSQFTVEGRGMLGVPGIAARTFGAVARQNASVLMISQSSSEQSICFVVPSDTEENVQRALLNEFEHEISQGDINGIQILNDVVIITVIGSGMRQTPGVSARIFNTLGRQQINVIAIAQGSSEYSISLVVDRKDAKLAVQQLHQEVIINGY